MKCINCMFYTHDGEFDICNNPLQRFNIIPDHINDCGLLLDVRQLESYYLSIGAFSINERV